MDAAFDWLVALTLRSTVVLSAALGLGWLLRGSSAAARHRLLTLSAVGLLALPALPWVLPRLELPIGFFRVESSIPAPAPVVAPLAETSVASDERSTTAPTPSRAGAAAAAPAAEAAGVPARRGVSNQAAFGAAAVMVWLS